MRRTRGFSLNKIIPLDSVVLPFGHDLQIDPKTNTWRCGSHGTHGDALELIAVKVGLISCGNVRHGCLKGIFGQVLREARRMGYAIPGGK